MSSEGSDFLRKLKQMVPGTEANKKANAVGSLYLQHRHEKDVADMEQLVVPLQRKQNEIFDSNKKRIFANIAELDSKGAIELDLRKMLPEYNIFWKEEAHLVDDIEFHLAASGAEWFSRNAGTSFQTEFQYYGNGVVRWLRGAPGVERGLWGVNE